MSVPSPREPWQQPTDELPTVGARRGFRRVHAVILAAVTLVVFAGSALAVALMRQPDDADAIGRPVLVVPSTSSPTTLPVRIFTTDPGAGPATTTAEPQPLPTRKPTPSTKPTTRTPEPTARPTTTRPPEPPGPVDPVQRGVRQGQPCAPVGAFGTTRNGTVLQCRPSPRDGQGRWRRV